MPQAGWEEDLASHAPTLSCDESWYKYASRAGQRVYAADPLLVRHPEGVWSNTWHIRRGVVHNQELRSVPTDQT